jgi:hypothetical protein
VHFCNHGCLGSDQFLLARLDQQVYYESEVAEMFALLEIVAYS